MAWWLEGVTFMHFRWVRNPPEAFLKPKNKRKNRKNEISWRYLYLTDILIEISKILLPASKYVFLSLSSHSKKGVAHQALVPEIHTNNWLTVN